MPHTDLLMRLCTLISQTHRLSRYSKRKYGIFPVWLLKRQMYLFIYNTFANLLDLFPDACRKQRTTCTGEGIFVSLITRISKRSIFILAYMCYLRRAISYWEAGTLIKNLKRFSFWSIILLLNYILCIIS